jgi:tetratricopeptide (TPR) repeat protein
LPKHLPDVWLIGWPIFAGVNMKAKFTGIRSFCTLCVFCTFCVISCIGKPGEETLIRYVRAGELYANGRFSEAAELLEKTGSFVPGLNLRGKAEYFAGETGKAEHTFRRAIKRSPAAYEAKFYLALILRERGEHDRAGELVEALLAEGPRDMRLFRFASALAEERGKSAEAFGLLDQGAELSAECALVFLDRARLHWVAGRAPEALDDLDRAGLMLPKNSPLLKSVSNLESRIKESLQ